MPLPPTRGCSCTHISHGPSFNVAGGGGGGALLAAPGRREQQCAASERASEGETGRGGGGRRSWPFGISGGRTTLLLTSGSLWL